MDHLLVLLLLLGSSGLQVEGKDSVRLVGGGSRCEGTLEVNMGEWRPMGDDTWTLKDSAVVCKLLDCGSPVSLEWKEESSDIPVWKKKNRCGTIYDLTKCVHPSVSSSVAKVTCSESVRLEDGTSLCSGRLEVKSNNGWYSQVCETNFDQQDAEVVCRELGCGAPSVIQGSLFGEIRAKKWTNEFQCVGNESSLLNCSSSGTGGRTCSAGNVGLICSEPVRLVRGAGRCAGALEVKLGDWRTAVMVSAWNLKLANAACRELDCGTAVSVDQRMEFPTDRPAWNIRPECFKDGSALKDCATPYSTSSIVNLTCSDSVKLVGGNSLCSGRLEVKSNNRWSWVCDADFDQQDAEVVCRELGCGAPSVLQGAEEEWPPGWTNVFECVGNESALLDCKTSGSVRNTCSPGKAVGLTCSEPMRLVGGTSRCAGTLEFKQGEWRPVSDQHFDWTLKEATVVCGHLNCGTAVSVGQKLESSHKDVWYIISSCVQSGSDLRSCLQAAFSNSMLDLNCSG